MRRLLAFAWYGKLARFVYELGRRMLGIVPWGLPWGNADDPRVQAYWKARRPRWLETAILFGWPDMYAAKNEGSRVQVWNTTDTVNVPVENPFGGVFLFGQLVFRRTVYRDAEGRAVFDGGREHAPAV
jgi:hypothetical protein